MSYPFPPELQQRLHEGLAAGNYQSEDEMLLEAMLLLRERDAYLKRFQERLKTRIERLDRGEGIQLEDDDALRDFFDDIQARGMQRYENRQAAK